MNPADIVLVGLGGGAGALLRWQLGRLLGERYHGNFPLATFIINMSGGFVIGFLSVYFGIDWNDRYGSFLKSSILTGVLGGYTTFSSMQLDALKLEDSTERAWAYSYLALSAFAGLFCAWVGASMARGLF